MIDAKSFCSSLTKSNLESLLGRELVPSSHGTKQDQYLCRCAYPDHPDKHPSFTIGVDTKRGGAYHWYYECKSCGRSGNIIKLIGELHNLDPKTGFVKIMQIMSEKTGVPLPDDGKLPPQSKSSVPKPLPEDVQEYLRGRGVQDMSLFAWDTEKKAIVIFYRTPEKVYPIIHNPNGEPKYKFPADSNKIWPFNMMFINGKDLYLTEGVFDQLTMRALGKEAVALLGCKLLDDTIAVLKEKAIRYITVALDYDREGMDGSVAIIKKLYKAGFPNVYFLDYEYYKKAGFEYRATKGADLNDFYRKDPDTLKTLVQAGNLDGYKLVIDRAFSDILDDKDRDMRGDTLRDWLAELPPALSTKAGKYAREKYPDLILE